MSLKTEEFLDSVDGWKLKLHERLKKMTAAQRRAYWQQIRDKAQSRGIRFVEPQKPAKRMRRTA